MSISFSIMVFRHDVAFLIEISNIRFHVLYRCQLWEKDMETKEMKEQLTELVGLLRQSETRRKEVEKELKLREQAVAIALATSASVRLCHFVCVFFYALT
jgi:hypothetical protein